MLRIRREQLEVLTAAVENRDLDELCAHLRQFFGAALARYDEGALRDRVRESVRRARRYGFEAPADLCRFLNLAAVFGWQFDDDPSLRGILSDPAVSHPSERLRLAVDTCLERLRVADSNRAVRAAFAAGSRR